MKKILAFILALAMVFTFVACGKDEKVDPENPDKPGQKVVDVNNPDDKTNTDTPDNQTGSDVTDPDDKTGTDTPDTPDDKTPDNPDDKTPTTKPEDNTPTKPEDNTPTKPEDNTPTKPDDNTPGTDTPTDPDPVEDEPDLPDDFDLEGMLYSGKPLSGLSDKEKDALVKAAEESGVKVEFQSDGTTIITDADGSVIRQKANGALIIKDGTDGTEATISFTWDSGPLKSILPAPGFGKVDMVMESDGTIAAQISGATADNYKSYCEACKKAGYKSVMIYTDDAETGYAFVASKSAVSTIAGGNMVCVALEDGTLVIAYGKLTDLASE